MQCEICGSKHHPKWHRLDRHHVSYKPIKFVYLCRQCHQFVHLFGLEKDIERAKQILTIAQAVEDSSLSVKNFTSLCLVS